MKIAVIGAGIAGLVSCKYAKAANYEVTVFEQTDQIGGTWIYSNSTGTDKYGLKIHSAMYKSLRTNLPKETMGFPDFEWPQMDRSYVTRAEVLEFLKSYANHFDLLKHIRFEHHVERISVDSNEKWRIKSKNLPSGEVLEEIFDAVFVCNGHYSTPNVPAFPGFSSYRGDVTHSHEYRVPDPFVGEKVLIIGSGPSGMDLARELSGVSEKVYWSHHGSSSLDRMYPETVKRKPDVVAFTRNGARFVDGTEEAFSKVLLCTGYTYTFPFLDSSCQIEVKDNHITPLYKHIVNINHPKMFFIGLPSTTFITPLFDLQVRFCMKFLSGGKQLPSKEEMRTDLEADIKDRIAKGFSKRKMHNMALHLNEYVRDLAQIAEIQPIRPIILKIYSKARTNMKNDQKNYRSHVFTILDDENFMEDVNLAALTRL